MESASKPSKPSSNITEIVSKFAKVRRFRSIGVFSDNPNDRHHQHQLDGDGDNARSTEDSSDATVDGKCDKEKIRPQSVEMERKNKESAPVEILKLFDTISSLKLAYVHLQEAHIPYDADKIRAADELFVSQLETLYKVKCAYKEKQFKKKSSISARLALLLAEVQVQEKLLKKLKSLKEGKEVEIADLCQELSDIDMKNRKLIEEFRKREQENIRYLNPPSVLDIVKAASKAIHDFAKPLIALLKVSGWDLDLAAKSIEGSAVFSKRSHKKYAFEAYIARRMFCGFSPQSYNVHNVLQYDDPINALIADPSSGFADFCKTKYLLVVHPKMEASFFGNLDQRNFVSSGRHPNTLFYQSFVKMARWVWVLQGVGASLGPRVEIFVVKRGSEFSDVYMECVEEQKEDISLAAKGQEICRVQFMVIPGFRIGGTLTQSRVYLSNMRSSSGTC